MLKKISFLCCFLLFFIINSQEQRLIKTKSISETKLIADAFVGVDIFGAIFYIKDQILYKNWEKQKWQYGDFSLGELTTVSLTNPLKIVLFYENTNTVVLLDKYLNEIDRIVFNELEPFRNVQFATAANDNSLWLFDNNTQQLELFDTLTLSTLVSSQPLSYIPNLQKSDYNHCWLATSTGLQQFNIYGSFIKEIDINDIADFQITNSKIYYYKDTALWNYDKSTSENQKLALPEIKIEQFYVNSAFLFVYGDNTLFTFELNPK